MQKNVYAIVDIETTGGFASGNQIIEIAVVVHDGATVVDRFETLLNPGMRIPTYIAGFTGISNEMVEDAPVFRDVSIRLFKLLEGKVFVAHNVNFDYSFVQKAFADVGIRYEARRLCTVRLARKIVPGFKSYSLGNLCQQLGIPLLNAHRAMGDASATAVLFDKLLAKDQEGHILQTLKRNSGELNLPPNITKKQFDQLPFEAGVYYFHDQKGKVIYVGKAINLKKRVASHFNGKNTSERKQHFMREIHDITFELCGNELVSLLLEAQEIKRLWPKYNRALKNIDLRFGLYDFEDRNGILNLGIDKSRKYFRPLMSFSNHFEARVFLDELVKKYSLDKAYCGLGKFDRADDGVMHKRNLSDGEHIAEYNRRVQEAINDIQQSRESFALFGEGRQYDEQSVILVQEGRYVGYGFVNREIGIMNREELNTLIRPAKDIAESYWIIRSYIQRNGAVKILRFTE